jgi:hypothetical protein
MRAEGVQRVGSVTLIWTTPCHARPGRPAFRQTNEQLESVDIGTWEDHGECE